MSYVISTNVRNIGSRTSLHWLDLNKDGYVIIDGYNANFQGVTGGETIDIRIGSPSNPITTVTLSALPPAPTELDAITSIINNINTAIPGIASIVPFIERKCIRLKHTTYVEVVNTYSRNTFDKIGLPQISRDSSNNNTYKIVDLSNGAGDRFDYLSLPVALDQGSNTVTLWFRFDVLDNSIQFGPPTYSLIWSNGVEGELNDEVVYQQLPFDGYQFSTVDGDQGLSVTYIFSRIIFPFSIIPDPIGSGILFLQPPPTTFTVPRGATSVRVLTTFVGKFNNEPPINGVKVSASLTQGAS